MIRYLPILWRLRLYGLFIRWSSRPLLRWSWYAAGAMAIVIIGVL